MVTPDEDRKNDPDSDEFDAWFESETEDEWADWQLLDEDDDWIEQEFRFGL